MHPGGTGLRRLTHNQRSDEDPDWAPQGHRLTYVHDDTIWTMRADGSDKISLGVRGSGPTWAPDGSLIAYIGQADGAIHTVKPDGTQDIAVGNPVAVGYIFGLDWRPRPQR
jgi:Tol biopolymer transport system component